MSAEKLAGRTNRTTQQRAVKTRSTPKKTEIVKTPLTISRQELLVDGSDAEFRRLVHNLFAFFSRHQSIRDGHAAIIGLAGVEYTVLISIAHLSKSEVVNIASVANHLHVSGTFITRVVKSLAKKGLVEKSNDFGDRRRVQLKITRKALNELQKLSKSQIEVNDIEFGCLTNSEFETLNAIVEKLIGSSDNAIALQTYFRKASEID